VSSHMLWNVSYAAVGSMLGRLSQLPDERTTMSASRTQGGCVAGLIFSLAGLPMINFFGARTSRLAGFPITTAIFALLMICGYLYIYKITAGKDPYDEASAGSTGKGSQESMKEVAGLALRNRPLLFIITADTFNNTATFMNLAFSFYYFTYVVRNAALLPVFLLVCSIAALTGSIAAVWVGSKIGKRNAYWIALATAACTYASAALLGRTVWSFTAVFCLAAVIQVVAGCMSTALFSDTVIYQEWKTGRNTRAFTMGLQNLTAKLSIFLRSAVVTVGLMAIGFVANQPPTPRVVEGIRAIMIFSPATACAIAAAIFYFGFRIDDKAVLRMQEEINARKTLHVGA